MYYRHFFLFIILFSLSQVSAASESSHSPADRTIIKKKIDVGGHRLNFNYTPGILPAIVFESAGGMDSSQWSNIQKTLSVELKNAIVSYDRSGYGKSEPYKSEYDIEKEVEGLHVGLEKLGLTDQVVLVGHSYGAFLIQMYAHKYPLSVQGLLYIDPNTVSFLGSAVEAEKYIQPFIMTFPAGEEPENGVMKSELKTYKAFSKTIEKMGGIGFPSISCDVISSQIRWMRTKQQNDRFYKGHEQLAEFCGTELIVANGVAHMIPSLAPELVMSKIKAILERK